MSHTDPRYRFEEISPYAQLKKTIVQRVGISSRAKNSVGKNWCR